MGFDLQPLINFIQTFPQWFQMLLTIIVVLGGGLLTLIKVLIAAMKAGLIDVLYQKKKKVKKK